MKYAKFKIIALALVASIIASCSKSDPAITDPTKPEETKVYYWSSVSAGQSHALALSEEGAIYVWGNNNEGQLGNGSTENISKPIVLNSSTKWTKAVTGYEHTLAIANDGSLWAWGKNDAGQLGLGTTGASVLAPTKVGNDTDWTSVAVGGAYSIALKKDGSLWSWGSHSNGSLGNNSSSGSTNIPTKVGTDSDWEKIYAFNNWGASFAIKKDGTLWAWGKAQNYMLGTGSTTNQLTPIQVGSNKKWKTIASDRSRNTFAIASDGTLWGVGRNNKGLLQQGNTTAQQSFVQIGTDTDWENVATFNLTVLASKKDGSLYGWGMNSYGELGNGILNSGSSDDLATATITKIEGQSNVKEITMAFNFSLLRKEKSKSICIAGSNLGSIPSLGTGNPASAPYTKHQCDITLF